MGERSIQSANLASNARALSSRRIPCQEAEESTDDLIISLNHQLPVTQYTRNGIAFGIFPLRGQSLILEVHVGGGSS